MTDLATDAFRTLGPSDAIPDDFVVPYYLDDRKLRISVARVGGRLYAFDDLCTCARAAVPAVRRAAHRDDAHVPVPRLAVRHHHRRRDQRAGNRATEPLRGARGGRRDSDPMTGNEQREQTRLALGAMAVPIFFVILFALCIIGTYHTPHPNHIKVASSGRRHRRRRCARTCRRRPARRSTSARFRRSPKLYTTSASKTSTRHSCRPRTRRSPRR